MGQQQSQMMQGHPQQQPQLQQPLGGDFNSSGSQEMPGAQPPDMPHQPALQVPQEMPDLSAAQDPALVGLSPSELEKHRQVC